MNFKIMADIVKVLTGILIGLLLAFAGIAYSDSSGERANAAWKSAQHMAFLEINLDGNWIYLRCVEKKGLGGDCRDAEIASDAVEMVVSNKLCERGVAHRCNDAIGD